MSDYQTRNYTAHGGKETVIGGKLTFLPGAEVEGLETLLPSAQPPQLPAQADSVATTVAAIKDDFNALLARMRAAGLMQSVDAGGDDDIAKKKVCADCMGAAKGYAWTSGGQGVLAAIGTDKTFDKKTGSNGCPDKSSNSMFSWAKSQGMDWGTIDTLPDIVGLAVRFDGHVGYTVGGGYAVEWRGFNYGCVKTKINGRGWTHWYKLPFIDYNDGAANVPEKEIALGSRLLRKDMEGSDVRALQEALMKLGYELPDYGADGEFGMETKEALMDFQKHEGLEVDGEYGEKSHAALMDALSDEEAGSGTAEPEPENPETPDEPKPLGTTVMITGGSVYVRVGNGTNYRAITTVKAGMIFDHVATARNGWNAIAVNGQVGWVSGKYSKVV